MEKKKPKKSKKEPQIVEIHIYIHQTPNFTWTPSQPSTNPNQPWNPPYTVTC